ncbi:hypothetical protein [Kitasatospora phosalacinea]|uniref:Uncharacterized protein n=1 Tax=Kitasatospora phosalacinea TaxID=2065 RepID=A0A9W6PPU4_9ACTN|nr:hypothetical protein [Kitasatospora phosalacinea]GLW59027.1 hypothetical protein Kpho01_70370 [Kitasatospora phosalacinea]
MREVGARPGLGLGRRVLDAAREDVLAIEDHLLADLEPRAQKSLRVLLAGLVGDPVVRVENGREYEGPCAPGPSGA